MIVKMKKSMLLGVALTVMFALAAGPAMADMAAAKKWVDEEFQPSTLTKAEQMKEMEWFIKASKPFKGMNIKVVSETIPTHEYEAKTLAKAFEEITGFSRAEVLGKNPRLLNGGLQGPEFYQALWDTLERGQVFSEVFINRRKNGDLFSSLGSQKSSAHGHPVQQAQER